MRAAEHGSGSAALDTGLGAESSSRVERGRFQSVESDGDGEISAQELGYSLRSSFTSRELAALVERFDKDKSGGLSAAEFEAMGHNFEAQQMVVDEIAVADFDADSSGGLDLGEFAAMLRSGGDGTLTKLSEVSRMFQGIDSDGNGQVSAGEMVSWQLSAARAEAVRLTDAAYYDANGDGRVSVEEFFRQFGELHLVDGLTRARVHDMVSAVDSDGDGTLSYEEFPYLLELNAPPPSSHLPPSQPLPLPPASAQQLQGGREQVGDEADGVEVDEAHTSDRYNYKYRDAHPAVVRDGPREGRPGLPTLRANRSQPARQWLYYDIGRRRGLTDK